MLKYCTLTGVDDYTDLDKLTKLSEEFPFVEWGMLYSKKRQGEGRYPSAAYQKDFYALPTMDTGGVVIKAIHLCGESVYDLIENINVEDELVGPIFSQWNRFQLNLSYERRPINRAKFARHVQQWSMYGHQTIIQANYNNREIISWPECQYILFDKSGGQGILLEELPAYDNTKTMCGYAGGYGPENIDHMFPMIAAQAQGGTFWIDMESKLRTNDVFDLEKCRHVLNVVKYHRERLGV